MSDYVNPVRSGLTKNQVAHAGQPSMALADFDPANPEDLMKFFQTQMADQKAAVTQAMHAQEERNEQIKALQAAQATLAQYKDQNISGNDPKYAKYIEDVKRARALMADGTQAAQELDAIIARAETKLPANADTDDTTDPAVAEQARKEGKTVEEIPNANGGGSHFRITGPAPSTGLTAADQAAITAHLKAQSDALQADQTFNMIRLQSGVEKLAAVTNTLSTLLKKFSDNEMAIISNIK